MRIINVNYKAPLSVGLLAILLTIVGSSRITAQEIGLEVSDQRAVLFGNSLQGQGEKFIWMPEQGALRCLLYTSPSPRD